MKIENQYSTLLFWIKTMVSLQIMGLGDGYCVPQPTNQMGKKQPWHNKHLHL
jgi:hypothetical protein